MVNRIIKWSPWPVPEKKPFQVKVELLRLEANRFRGDGANKGEIVMAEVRWKGAKPIKPGGGVGGGGLGSLRRSRPRSRRVEEESERRNSSADVSRERGVGIGEGKDDQESSRRMWVVDFGGEEFERRCEFTVSPKDTSFYPSHLSFSLLYGEGADGEKRRKKMWEIGCVSLNIAEIAFQQQRQERGPQNQNSQQDAADHAKIRRNLPLSLYFPSGVASDASLLVSLSFIGIRTSSEWTATCPEAKIPEKQDSFIRRMASYVSTSGRYNKNKKNKKTEQMEESKNCGSSSGFYGDSEDCCASSISEWPDDEQDPTAPEKLGYSPIASASNLASMGAEDDSVFCYSSSQRHEEASSVTQSESNLSFQSPSASPSKSGLLTWKKKRRASFRGGQRKDEPLLRRENEEGGGDDIDFVCRHLSSSSRRSASLIKDSNEKLTGKYVPSSEFGNDDFKVANWEERELMSRDGQTKLKTNVFFASIDQRSESAAGESACAVLAAVIADWLQANPGVMPTKSEFDNLILEGSLEWRKLCEDESYRKRFPDKHFDLDTVLEAGIRPISVAPEESFIGFFRPECFEFLQGAMSFDEIWLEISTNSCNCQPRIYIVSWNDHFFILKVDADAFYIIDTLGERLFEGCNQAYILKFDKGSLMFRVRENVSRKKDCKGKELKRVEGKKGGYKLGKNEDGFICRGMDCCREFIKRFLAAIPLGQVEIEAKNGITCGSPLFRRLQIEFHFSTSASSSLSSSLSSSAISSPWHPAASITRTPTCAMAS